MSTRPTKSRRGWKAAGLTLLAGGGVVAAGVVLGGGSVMNGRWSELLALPQFRLFAIIAAVSLLGLAGAVGLVFRAGRRRLPWRGNLAADQAGTAIIEFALVLPIALMLALLMLQSSLLMGAYQCVNYASYAAARSAVVYIPQTFANEPANTLADFADHGSSAKLSRIHAAAAWAVLPVGDGHYPADPAHLLTLQTGLEQFYAGFGRTPPNWVARLLAGKLAYAQDYTRVAIDRPLDEETFGEHEDIRVVVSHDLYLAVPYAARVLAILDADHAVDFGDGRYALTVTIPCRMTIEGVSDVIDVEVFPDNP